MNVLVLDGNENQAVACVRSLARAGHRVHVGASTSWSKAGLSRYCAGSFRYPSPEHDVPGFVRSITDAVVRLPSALVLPMTERTTLPLSAERSSVETVGGRFVLPSHETVLRAFDKSETMRVAASVGVDVPKTAELRSSAEAEAFATRAQFPVVLKGRSSEEISTAGQVVTAGAPLYARSQDELLSAFETLHRRTSVVLAQEFIAGTGAGYFALMRHGELRAEFAHQRLRDVRPTGSGSALRVSVALDPRVRESGVAILRALGWHGVAMVEFRMRPDGTPVFLEVNGRFWNSLALAVYAGMDFPAMLAELAERGDIAHPRTYRVGVRCRWLLGDFRHLVEVFRGRPREYPGTFPARLATLGAFLRPVPGTYHDNFLIRDPLPELGDWVDFATRKVWNRLRKSRAVAAC